jgi:flagellar protein FliO/FliZ
MSSSALPSGTELLLAAAFLLLLLLAALWALRRGPGGNRSWRLDRRRLQTLEVRAFGPRHRVVLMRVDDKELLLGVSPAQISVLHRWRIEPGVPPSEISGEPVQAQRP